MIQTEFTPYWPTGCDGTQKYPRNHQLIFQSNRVNVVRVFIGPGEAELPHTHNFRSLMAVDQPTKLAVKLVNEIGLEKLVFEGKDSPRNPYCPQFHNMEPEPYHYVTNLNKDKDYLATRFEMRDKDPYKISRLLIEKQAKIFTKNSEEYLIGNASTALKVSKAVEYNYVLHSPLDNLKNRPPIWFLEPNQCYWVQSFTDIPENVHLLEVGYNK